MKKGQLYEGTVVKTDFPNKGTVDCGEDGIAIVKGTLPGQKVSFVVSKKRSGKSVGRLKEVLEKSPLENVEPLCPHFGDCGGCSYQTMDYDNQTNLKREMVKNILDNAIDGEYEFEGILKSPTQWEYRNKMEFSFGDEYKDGPLALGLHKKGSFHDIVTAHSCKIVNKDYNDILKCVLDYCAGRGLSFYHKMRHEGFLRHLLIRRGVKTKQIIVSLVTTSNEEEIKKADLQGMVSELCKLNLECELCGVLHIINDGVADVVKSDEIRVLYGEDVIFEELLGLKFKISTFSFFQTNSLGAEVLYSKAREYVGETKDKLIFDLYSGTGTIAQILAPVAKKVVGVEIVEEAVEAAKENAKLNGLDNCEFIAGDVLKVIDEIQDKPDLIVLDPPRDGINPKALKKIIDFGVDRMVYISCKPTSLARDLEMLQECGYKVEKACAVDMFPGTVHVETVVLLSQHRDKGICLDERGSRQMHTQASALASLLAQKPDDYTEMELELDELDLTSAESKATYAEIKDYVLKEYGLKVSNLYISQVKRKCGIEVGENYNLRKATRRMDCLQSDSTTAANRENDNSHGLPKSEDSRQPQCPEEKEKAIRDALEHFGMI